MERKEKATTAEIKEKKHRPLRGLAKYHFSTQPSSKGEEEKNRGSASGEIKQRGLKPPEN